MSIRKLLRVRSVAALSAVAATVLLLTACVGGAATAPDGAGTTTLHLVGFAVPKEANNAIQKKFAETPEGKDVVWEESYGASGDQSRAVVNGLQADYVNFSLEGDVTRLVKAGLVDETGSPDPPRESFPIRPSSSWCRRAIRSASRTGRTWSSRVSRSSRPTRRPPVRRVGTSWRPISR